MRVRTQELPTVSMRPGIGSGIESLLVGAASPTEPYTLVCVSGRRLRCACSTSPWRIPTGSGRTTTTCCSARRWAGSRGRSATGFGFSDPFPRAYRARPRGSDLSFPCSSVGSSKCSASSPRNRRGSSLTLNSLFSALTALTIWEIAERCFNHNVARWSAWIWALYPAAMQYAVRWIWDTSLTTFSLQLGLVLWPAPARRQAHPAAGRCLDCFGG